MREEKFFILLWAKSEKKKKKSFSFQFRGNKVTEKIRSGKHKSKACIKYTKDHMRMKFHKLIQNQTWKKCTAIIYESICDPS